MNKYVYWCLLLILLGAYSCRVRNEFVYPYETDPVYSWGFAYFYGPHYQHYQNNNNVLTINLLTDSLVVSEDDNSSIVGFGQYLYLEDVFVPANDTLLPAGTYTVSKSGEAFTIDPGEGEFDGMKIDAGAYIYFIEQNESFSTRKFIVDGTMQVAYDGDETIIGFDLVLDDDSELKGTFRAELPYFDFSGRYQDNVNRMRSPFKIN